MRNNTRNNHQAPRRLIAGLICLCLMMLNSCNRRVGALVVYSSVDQPIARKVLDDFTRKTGIAVQLVSDTEATKSVGLAERLRAEQRAPRADVWWGNEPFHTIRLADEKILLPYDSPESRSIDAQYKDPNYRWTGNGLRARVLLLNSTAKHLVALESLADPSLKGKIGMARPTAGTTGGHVACLFLLMGDERAIGLFQSWQANGIHLMGGNGEVADAVANGTLAAGLTDTDDAENALANTVQAQAEALLTRVYPGVADQPGTLALPTTVGLVKDSSDARKLVDFLLSPDTESALQSAKFTCASVRSSPPFAVMKVDLTAAARRLPGSVRKATEILEGR